MKTKIAAPAPRGYTNAYAFTITLEGGSTPQPLHPKGSFAVTGDIYHKATRTRTGDGTRACGCLHEDALHAFPSLAFLVSMHLSDSSTGEPMYAEENGFYRLAGACPEATYFGQQYHAGNSERHFPLKTPPPADKPWATTEYRRPTADECLESLAGHLRCPIEEARQIKAQCLAVWQATPTATKAKFAEIVAAMRPRWAAEAAQAHRQIEAIASRRPGETVRYAIIRANLVK
mgnify:CR=1 FL=1